MPSKGLAGPLVLRERPRRPRVAARRARRTVQHRGPRLDGHAADGADRHLRLHPADEGALRDPRPHRGDAGEHVRARPGLGRRPLPALGARHGAPGDRLRRAPRPRTTLRDRDRRALVHDPRPRSTNEGWFDTPHQLLYHFNLGFPLLGDGRRGRCASAGDPDDLSFSTEGRRRRARRATRWRTVDRPGGGLHPRGLHRARCGPDADGWAVGRAREPAPAAGGRRDGRLPALRRASPARSTWRGG